MNVRAFQPRKIDPPHFVAEDDEALREIVGSFIGGEQCDGCGNHSYRVEENKGGNIWFVAVCAVDPDEDHEFVHPEPCGTQWPIQIWDEDEVTF